MKKAQLRATSNDDDEDFFPGLDDDRPAICPEERVKPRPEEGVEREENEEDSTTDKRDSMESRHGISDAIISPPLAGPRNMRWQYGNNSIIGSFSLSTAPLYLVHFLYQLLLYRLQDEFGNEFGSVRFGELLYIN